MLSIPEKTSYFSNVITEHRTFLFQRTKYLQKLHIMKGILIIKHHGMCVKLHAKVQFPLTMYSAKNPGVYGLYKYCNNRNWDFLDISKSSFSQKSKASNACWRWPVHHPKKWNRIIDLFSILVFKNIITKQWIIWTPSNTVYEQSPFLIPRSLRPCDIFTL